MEFSLSPHAAEAVSGQLPIVPKVNIVKVHQSGAQDTQHPGPVPCAVFSVWSSHNIPDHDGLHPLLLENRRSGELHTGGDLLFPKFGVQEGQLIFTLTSYSSDFQTSRNTGAMLMEQSEPQSIDYAT